MENQPQNPYKPSEAQDAAPPRADSDGRFFALFVLLFEVPAILLVLHAAAYVNGLPGSEVTVDYGGKQPVFFGFFEYLATGGLLAPFVVGIGLCFLIPVRSCKAAAFKLGLVLGLSYIAASFVWCVLIGFSVLSSFI